MAEYPTHTLDATHPERDDGPATMRNRRLTYLVAFVALAALVGSAVVDDRTSVDIWGVSTKTVSASAGGTDLEVRYPTVSRPALATPFDIVVHRAGGFDGPLDIAMDPNWIEMWDYQSFYPNPSESTGEPDRLVFSFDPPDGDVLRVFFDARIQPAQQSGRSGWVAVLDELGDTVVRVDFTTRVRP